MTVMPCVTILAAGKGTRMRNGLAKALHPLAGVSLIAHVLRTAAELAPSRVIVVLAPDMPEVEAEVRRLLPDALIRHQHEPRGTGDALRSAADGFPEQGTVLVLYGDTPLMTAETLRRLMRQRQESEAAVAVLGFRPPEQGRYGRLQIEGGRLAAIVEHDHAGPALLAEAPCNSGVMALDAGRLPRLLADLPLHGEKNEYYLTDVVALAGERGWSAVALEGPWQEAVGVNAQAELAAVESLFQQRARAALLESGVILTAPETVHLAFDTVIHPGAMIEPYVVFGPGVEVAEGAVVHAFTRLEGVRVGTDAEVGPFARIRPGTVLETGAKLGSFVDAKAAHLGRKAKVPHLSYIGDCTIGAGSNLGAGTITCNYDGYGKYRTEIGEGAFIGSHSSLVAPVRIGPGAITGAGSTIVRDVPGDALAIARAPQENREDMAPRLREKQQARKAGRAGKEKR